MSTCKNGKVKGQLKQILDKVRIGGGGYPFTVAVQFMFLFVFPPRVYARQTKQNIGYIVDARACATFSPRDAKSVVQWNANMAALAQSPLNEYRCVLGLRFVTSTMSQLHLANLRPGG